MTRRLAWAVLGLTLPALALVAASGVVRVEPGEALVVRRLGRTLPRPLASGAHWLLPLGIDRVDRVRTDEVRRLEVGLAGVPGAGDDPGAGEFLTGDLNLIRAEASVQYRAADPIAFALAADRIEPLLDGLGAAALARALARRGIDDALGPARLGIASEVADELAHASDRLGLGLAILGVSLTEARPPEEVRDDFDAAQAARSIAERRLLEALGHAERAEANAASESDARLDRAHALADRRVALDAARADRFKALRTQVDAARSLTIGRLYLDALRDLLPRVGRTIVLSPGEPLDLTILDTAPRSTNPRRSPPEPSD